jgi:hypothetical protein
MRKKEFRLKDVKTPPTSNDSRFGLRRWASKESPSIFTYPTPGKGVQGEHQN